MASAAPGNYLFCIAQLPSSTGSIGTDNAEFSTQGPYNSSQASLGFSLFAGFSFALGFYTFHGGAFPIESLSYV